MVLQPSDQYLFSPLIPGWLWGRCAQNFIRWHESYEDLAAQYSLGNQAFYDAPNITLEQLNTYLANGQDPPYDVWLGPFIKQNSESGYPISNFAWPIDTPPPEEFEPYYAACMAFGLAQWQMYKVYLAQQMNRFGHFGYYGRKKQSLLTTEQVT